jgi:hypothetical protein
MIKTSSKQTGSAHVIIIVILVIALLGTLGFVFWQSFMNKSTQKTSDTTQNKPAKDMSLKAEKLTESYVLPKENLAFSYPKTWTMTTVYTNKNSDIGDNRALLVSPGNFALEISIPSYGPSWQFGERPFACPFDEGYNGFQGGADNHPDACPFYSELLSEKQPNLDGVSIMAFEKTWESADVAPNNASLMLVKTGCKMPENNLCERPSAKAGFYLDVHGQYYEKISDKSKEDAGISSDFTLKQIKDSDFIKSQDVLTAIAILKSIKY